MAAKKTETTVTDPWKDMVKIRLPKAVAGESKYQFVAVNCHTFQIEKNKEVEVPRPIAEAITAQLDAQSEADDYVEANTSK